MSEIWTQVPPSERLTVGTHYRVHGAIRAPYNATTRALVAGAMRVQMEAKGYRWEGFDHAAPVFVAHSGELAPWPFNARFTIKPDPGRVEAGLDPRGILALIALIVTATLAFRLVDSRVDKLVQTVGEQIRGVTDKVLEPGTVILIVLAIALVVGLRPRSA